MFQFLIAAILCVVQASVSTSLNQDFNNNNPDVMVVETEDRAGDLALKEFLRLHKADESIIRQKREAEDSKKEAELEAEFEKRVSEASKEETNNTNSTDRKARCGFGGGGFYPGGGFFPGGGLGFNQGFANPGFGVNPGLAGGAGLAVNGRFGPVRRPGMVVG